MKRNRTLLMPALVLACLLPSLYWPAEVAAEPLALESRRELLVDRYLIDSLEGAELYLHEPVDRGTVLHFDRPWEGLFSGYCTIIQADGKYQLYYRGRPELSHDGSDAEITCYAESEDGIHWHRPSLGQYQFNGSKENNIVLADAAPVTHNFSPFLDTNPKADPQQRYKAIGGSSKSGMIAYVSADGKTWTRLREEPIIKDSGWVFDSQNVAFWSESEQKYVAYYRKASEKIRSMARVTSDDFLHWDEPVPMTYSNTGGPTPKYHLYTNQTHAYFRAPHIYIATAARFMPGRRVISPQQAEEIGVHPKYFNDTADAVLMTSRGGNLYDCTFDQGFLRPGTGLGNWVSRTNYPVLNVVPTGADEMSLYVNRDYGQPSAHVQRYSLRLDGFGSARARREPGTLITKPFTFTGDRLSLNFATSAAGGIKVEIQDADGQPLSGYALSDAVEMIGNEIERDIQWKQGSDVGSLAGKVIRLKFVLNDADLFALQFRPESTPAVASSSK